MLSFIFAKVIILSQLPFGIYVSKTSGFCDHCTDAHQASNVYPNLWIVVTQRTGVIVQTYLGSGMESHVHMLRNTLLCSLFLVFTQYTGFGAT